MKQLTIIMSLLLTLSVYPEQQDEADVHIGEALTTTFISSQADALLLKAKELEEAGISLPKELYPAILSASHLRNTDEPVILSKLSYKLDGYHQELDILRDSPDQLGNSELILTPTIRAGEAVEIRQIYTAGAPLGAGAGIVVAKHWQHDIHYQASDSSNVNFVSVTSSNPAVIFSPNRVKRKGIHGSRYGLAEQLFFEIAGGDLATGDTVTITYGAGDQKFDVPEIASKHVTLPLYLRLHSAGPFFTVPVLEFEVVAGEPSRLVVLAPSIQKTDKLFDLTIRAEDRFGNLARGATPQLEIIVDGVFQQRVQLPANNVLSVKGPRFDSEGLHEITVRSGGGGLVGHSNPILVDNDLELNLVWVNLHQHSSESDAIQSPAEIKLGTKGFYDLNLIADHDDFSPRENTFSLESIIEKPKVVSLPLSQGGHHVVIPAEAIPGNRRLVVALPEVPPDHRGLSDPMLVEIHSGSSSYEWLGQYYSNLGYRVGFTANRTSHLPVRNLKQGQTAIFLSENEELGSALYARHTYATTGPRTILLVDVNGGLPGSRIPMQDRRLIKGNVYSSSPIDSIELIRNGEVIDRYIPPAEEGSLRVKVMLGSDSKPIAPGWDLPRNGREWLGYLRVLGARVTAVSAPGYENRKRTAISVNPAEAGRVDFISWTHGSESSFSITLEELEGEEISLDMSIKEGYEDADLLPLSRKPSETPAFHQQIALSEIVDSGAIRLMDVNGYDDYVRFELVNPSNASSVSFSFVDTRKLDIDDYYYVKVKQADDHTLWSSPVHVGGFDLE